MFPNSMFPNKPNLPIVSKCPSCGLPNKCGLELGKGTCWCFTYPPLGKIPQQETDKCLCESCFKKKKLNDNN